MSFSVTVRIAQQSSIVLDVSSGNTVKDLKDLISAKTQLKPETFNFIFSGKILEENAKIQDLSLGFGSVLHLYTGQSTTPAEKEPGKDTHQYYVYCKTCEGLQPGKLRVCCSRCSDGAIVLQQEPDNWEDVLVPGKLTCHCTACNQISDAQFYFKCGNHDSVDHAIPLQYIRPNTRSIECVTCTAVSSPILVYPCRDKHVICVECFTSYISVSLDNKAFVYDQQVGYSLPCPAGCENSLIQDIHHFHLLGTQQYERYKDFGAEECLIQSGGVICPEAGCGEGMIVDQGVDSVVCGNCRFEFCCRCKEAAHHGDCDFNSNATANQQMSTMDTERSDRARWDNASKSTILQISKPCPQCGTRTEKNGGCMHIKCTVCKQNWCWLCEKDWTRTCQAEHWFGGEGAGWL